MMKLGDSNQRLSNIDGQFDGEDYPDQTPLSSTIEEEYLVYDWFQEWQ